MGGALFYRMCDTEVPLMCVWRKHYTREHDGVCVCVFVCFTVHGAGRGKWDLI